MSGTASETRSEYWFDERTADSAVTFVEKRCFHWQGEWAGKPFILEPWQRDEIIRPLFGWKRKDPTIPRVDWVRRYTSAYLEVGKGNGKTPLGAVILLLLMFWDCEFGAELYSAAGDREQAALVFEDFSNMVRQSPKLMDKCRIIEGRKRIVRDDTKSKYIVLSRDAGTKHGFKPHGIVFDELHVQRDRKLWATLRQGLMKRRQPLMLAITTAGEYDPDSLWWSEREYAQGVESGKIRDDNHLAKVYAADPKDDPSLEETWKKANPNYGVSVKRTGLQKLWREASQKGPAAQSEFKQLHLNIAGQSVQAVIDMTLWQRCKRPPKLDGPCFIGVDLSTKLALTSVVALFPETWSVVPFFFLPGDNLEERQRKDAFDYKQAVERGEIEITGGAWIDQRAPRRVVNELGEKYDVVEVGYDTWNGSQFATWLQDDDGFEIVEIRQGYKTLSEPMKTLVGKVGDKALRVGDNRTLDWNAENLTKRADPNDNWMPHKDQKGRKRIDGMSALLNAVVCYLNYEDHEIVVSTAG